MTSLLSDGVLIALGGNSIAKAGERGTISQQWAHTLETAEEIADLWGDSRFPLVICHGNGPQIGRILLRSELAAKEIDPLPLDVAVADSQAGMGYMIQQLLSNALGPRLGNANVVTLVTRVDVDPADPAFQRPTKPIGMFYAEQEAHLLAGSHGWVMREDAGRGWRRVVASPRPLHILETKAIRDLVVGGEIVIAAGGGGIPVISRPNGGFDGVACVIDKDLASALLAKTLGFKTLLIVTGVPRVCIDWGLATQREVDRLRPDEATRFLDEGQFPAGSMGPKIEAAVQFARAGGTAIITQPGHLGPALRGEQGTWIVEE
jgi:carbamate kinase